MENRLFYYIPGGHAEEVGWGAWACDEGGGVGAVCFHKGPRVGWVSGPAGVGGGSGGVAAGWDALGAQKSVEGGFSGGLCGVSLHCPGVSGVPGGGGGV